MHRLSFNSFSFEFLEGGKQDLVLEPMVGDSYIDFDRDVEVIFSVRVSKPPSCRPGGGYAALYLLLYGDKVKIGSSSVSTVVERMYSQTPRADVIADVHSLFKSIPQLVQYLVEISIEKELV